MRHKYERTDEETFIHYFRHKYERTYEETFIHYLRHKYERTDEETFIHYFRHKYEQRMKKHSSIICVINMNGRRRNIHPLRVVWLVSDQSYSSIDFDWCVRRTRTKKQQMAHQKNQMADTGIPVYIGIGNQYIGTGKKSIPLELKWYHLKFSFVECSYKILIPFCIFL